MMVIKEKSEVIKAEKNDIESKFVNLNKLREVEFKEYESKNVLFNNLLTKERAVSFTYNQFLLDEKTLSKKLRTECNNTLGESRNLKLALERLRIEVENVKNHNTFVTEQYKILKSESSKDA